MARDLSGFKPPAAVPCSARRRMVNAPSAADPPALILMDMSLPVVDGWEAARRLKAAPETHAIPIIALTAHAMVGDREKAIEAGCDDYDTKPVEFQRLLEKIDGILSKATPR